MKPQKQKISTLPLATGGNLMFAVMLMGLLVASIQAIDQVRPTHHGSMLKHCFFL